MSRSFTPTTITAVIALSLALGTACVALADDGAVNAGEASAALDAVATYDSKLIDPAVASTEDADSTAQTPSIDIPVNPDAGIKLKAHNGQVITVLLPETDLSGKGTRTNHGSVVYAGTSNSANTVIPTTNGAQFLTTIKGRHAPTSFSYDMQVSSDSVLVRVQPNGSALILSKNGDFSFVVDKPWARDAKGRTVATYFTTDGSTLTQVVDHHARGVAYPVVIDPRMSWWWGGVDIHLTRGEMIWVRGAGWAAITALVPASFLGQVALGTVTGVIDAALPQNKCLVMHLSWIRPYSQGLERC